ncbi:hypothetical protein [Streptomyces sp. NPDC015350]|uniref:hypothetical protein n=1 Tax=Streptomyces sp. NPDC015350 TaxID=3364955 RepID=UPI0036FB90C8
MIHIAETVTIGSVEGFLTPGERDQLAALMRAFLTTERRSHFGEQRNSSIHEIPGHTPEQAMAVYEPAGRVEIPKIPEPAEQLLQDAFDRARPALSRVMPSITTCRPWTYVEYGPGQHITSHLDGIAPDPLAWPRQIAGISVVISEVEAGGGFHVETSSDGRLWNTRLDGSPGSGYAPGMWLAHDGADHSAGWFAELPRTRWTVSPAPGTALLYGSQLAHGTEPVVRGRCAKFISWLTAEAGER